MSNKLLTQKEACKYLNISRTTILRWEDEGVVNPIRTTGKHRRYKIEDLDRLLNKKYTHNKSRNCLIYARVSTKKQQQSGNLDRQSNRLMEYAVLNKFHISNIYKEVASGINENRKELMKLLEDIKNPDVNYLIIEYKDRLARFGYKYLEKYCKSHNVEIIVLDNQEEKDLTKEMVEDMISIITSFSARIYGKRGGEKVKETLSSLGKEGEGN
jgi:excisionase family DNA binding protein